MSSLTLLRPATPPSLYVPPASAGPYRELQRTPSPQPSLQSDLSYQDAYELLQAQPAQRARAVPLQLLPVSRTPSPGPAYPGATGATPGPAPGLARPPRVTSPAPWVEPAPAPSACHKGAVLVVRIVGALVCLAVPAVLVYAGAHNKNQ